MQAALGFGHSRGRVITHLDFRNPGAAIQRKHRNGLAIEVEVIQRHGMPLEHFHFDDRLGMFPAAEEFVTMRKKTASYAREAAE